VVVAQIRQRRQQGMPKSALMWNLASL
jgi:hypothetical protein